MTRLLHISASPRGAKSESLALAETFLSTYQDVNPHVEIETWNPVGRPAGVRSRRSRGEDGSLRRC
jgi:FMN-dependent NADH-azoreductase